MRSFGGSLCNMHEVEVIAAIVRMLLTHGIEPTQLGVIAPYRAQTFKIIDALSQITVTPTATQWKPPPTDAQHAGSRKKRSTKSVNLPIQTHAEPTSEDMRVSAAAVQVSTVDAFQGAEKVRAPSTSHLLIITRVAVCLTFPLP